MARPGGGAGACPGVIRVWFVFSFDLFDSMIRPTTHSFYPELAAQTHTLLAATDEVLRASRRSDVLAFMPGGDFSDVQCPPAWFQCSSLGKHVSGVDVKRFSGSDLSQTLPPTHTNYRPQLSPSVSIQLRSSSGTRRCIRCQFGPDLGIEFKALVPWTLTEPEHCVPFRCGILSDYTAFAHSRGTAVGF